MKKIMRMLNNTMNDSTGTVRTRKFWNKKINFRLKF